MIGPGWCCDFSFEGLIACPAYLLRLIDSRVVADGCFRSSNHDFIVVALDIARVEGHVTQGEVEPQPEDEVQRGRCILECFLITRYAGMSTGEAIASSIFAINCFLASNPVPALRMFEHVWACAPRIAHTYVRILSLRRSTPAWAKPSDLSRMNVVQALEMSRLCLIESLG